MIGIDRLAPKFERAHFGETHGQTHRQFNLARLLAVAQSSDQRRVTMDFVHIERHDVAVRVVTGGRAVERESDGAVGERLEFPAFQVERSSLLSPARQDADGPYLSLGDARAGLHPDVVSAGAAATDAQASAFPDIPIIGRANGDRALRRFVAQHLWLPRLPFLAKPSSDGLDNSFARDGRREEAAV